MSGFCTSRLEALPLTPADAPFFERLWADERVAQFLGGRRGAQQVRDTVAAGLQHWQDHGFGRWVLLAAGTPIGTVKLATWHARGHQEVELGYALLPDWWGHGYATEAGTGVLEHARTVLGLSEVVAFTLPENHSSRAVLQRLGFEEERRFLLGAREHVVTRKSLGAGRTVRPISPVRPTS